MTSVTPPSNQSRLELTDYFRTASEFFDREEPSGDPDGPRPAKGVLWYDQATPVYYCCPCHEHVASLRWDGDEQVADYEEKRAEAYRELYEGSPTCDLCAGKLLEKVRR